MSTRETKLWRGLSATAQRALTARDYKTPSLAERLSITGVDAAELIAADKTKGEIKQVALTRKSRS